jgi:hypothetical protein
MTSMGVHTQAPSAPAHGCEGSARRRMLQPVAPVACDRQGRLAQITVP